MRGNLCIFVFEELTFIVSFDGMLYLQLGNSQLIEQSWLGFGRCGDSWTKVSGCV